MKQLIPCLLVVLFCTCSGIDLGAQALQLQWAHAITGPGNVSVSELVTDGRQQVYALGTFEGTVDFDPGSGTSSLTADTAFGTGTTFLAKYNVLGQLVFVRQYHFAHHKIALDPSGNVWLAGRLSGTKDFDPGPGAVSLSSAGSTDIYLAKYDSTGAFLNAFKVGDIGMEEVGDLELDEAGSAYITGSFSSNTVDFDPGTGTSNLSGASSGRIYLAKYSNAGALLFAVRLFSIPATSGSNEGVTLAHDANNNIYLGGRFNGTINLDPSANTSNLTSVGVDGFVAKYDPSGNFLYGYNIDGNVYDIQLDAAGNRWVAGTTPDSMDADPGPGKAMIYSKDNFDIYLAKYDANGGFLHVKAFESKSFCTPESLAIDKRGSAYLYGRFPDSLDVNPGGTGGRLISNGLFDGFVVRYGSAGNFEQAFAVGSTTSSDRVFGMATDTYGNVWMAGHLSGTVDVDPGSGTVNLSSPAGLTAGFIVRFGDPLATDVPAGTRLVPKTARMYSSNGAILVDCSSLEQVDAVVRVYNTSGQLVANAHHRKNDILRLPLPPAAGLYLVSFSNEGQTTTARVWVD